MKFLKKRKYQIIIAIALIGVLLARLNSKGSSQHETYTVSRGSIKEELALSGEVDAKRKEELHFAAGGLVVYYPWNEGDEIKKYQTIASLDQRQLQKSLEKYLNVYGKQLNSFSQTRDNNEEDIKANDISDELRRTLENSQYDLDNAVLDVELQDLSIKLSRLYAPFDGILISSPITSSSVNVSALDTFVIVDPTSLYFTADLDEGDLSRVNETLPVIIYLDAYPELEISSNISSISYSSKETSTGTTYEVELTLPEDLLSKLRLGLNGEADIVLAEKSDILILPIETIKEDGNKSFVMVSKDGKVEEIEVKTGISDNDNIEIISGLSEGDMVVIEK